MNYEQNAEVIALSIWEESTNNGLGLDMDLHDSHMAKLPRRNGQYLQGG